VRPGVPEGRGIEVVAHRGASQDVPEHTLAAYRKAIEDGADALECDVRLTADGTLVCVHDRRVNRTSNGRGAVSSMELADLAQLDFGSWHGRLTDAEEPDRHWSLPVRGRRAGARGATTGTLRSRGPRGARPGRNGHGAQGEPLEASGTESAEKVTDHAAGSIGEAPDELSEETSRVLTLERLLELVVDAGRRVELAIETKHPTRWAGQVEQRLLDLLTRFDLSRPRPGTLSPVRVMSFSPRSLRRIHEAAPELPTVFLMQVVLPRHRDGRLPPGVRIAGPGMRILRAHPDYVERVHRAGNRVHVWTVDDPADVALCAELGVDAIITNRPRAVLDQLEELGRRGPSA
jgi:glycerophosphoryl diester phosphodiesterase